MNICFIICGQPRSIKMIINNINILFINYNYDFYLSLSKNKDNYEKEYLNKNDISDLYFNNKIKKILLINDKHDESFRNSLNYIYKINDILNIIDNKYDNKYDIYILLRTDLLFNNIDFINKINDVDLYFCSKNYNQFIKNINNKINDNIIITKNYSSLLNLKNIYEFALNNNDYSEIILYNYLLSKNINYKLIDIDYKLILSSCNIIAIAGDSGSGKTTLLNDLITLFDDNFLKLETDRYHKWERGDINYNTYTHLNPYANHLEKMSEDIYNLKIGNEIYSVDYDHNTGKFTSTEKIEPANHILLCGLHTLYNNKINDIINIKIFMDTDRNLIKKWKINRDVNERGYDLKRVLKQIDIRQKDYDEYIKNQKDNADIIVNYYESNNLLCCKIIIKNKIFIYKIINSNINLEYNLDEQKNIIFLLNNNFNLGICNIIKYIL
jgi:uridine kinase